MYQLFLKRLFDIVFSFAALLILSPLIVLVTFLLSTHYWGTPFFIQPRPGRAGRIFNIIKFKTMNDRRDSFGNLLPDRDRLTSMGRIIRLTSMDEILQLINVLKGEMSLVGPRPLLVKYVSLYNDRQFRRHEVRPGITGWAQVNGRNAISWQERFDMDLYYVENLSFWLDIKIILMTVKKVFKREGIAARDSATMEAFKGN